MGQCQVMAPTGGEVREKYADCGCLVGLWYATRVLSHHAPVRAKEMKKEKERETLKAEKKYEVTNKTPPSIQYTFYGTDGDVKSGRAAIIYTSKQNETP
ncbi:hypothetical protein PspLS_05294 [Pyricularia sp. CBS 133598]|nr:hypothetical protein PspLS_05294 [Pyricularia sp. CBS 133598]